MPLLLSQDVKERGFDQLNCFGRGKDKSDKWWKALFFLLEKEKVKYTPRFAFLRSASAVAVFISSRPNTWPAIAPGADSCTCWPRIH